MQRSRGRFTDQALIISAAIAQSQGEGEHPLPDRHFRENAVHEMGDHRTTARSHDMLSTAYPCICGVNGYAEYQRIAMIALAGFQGFALSAVTICFAYSFQSNNLL